MRRLAVALALVGATTRVHAHPEPYPKRDRLELRRDRITLIIDYAIADSDEAHALWDAFDRDRSGVLDDDERARLAAYLADQAARFARLDVDGAPRVLTRVRATPRLSPARLETQLVLEAQLTTAPRRVQLADRHKDRRITVPVELVADGVTPASALPPGPYVFADHPLVIELAPFARP